MQTDNFFGFLTVNMGGCIFLCVQRVSSECSGTGPQKCGVHSPSHSPPACISCKLKDTVLETSFEFLLSRTHDNNRMLQIGST